MINQSMIKVVIRCRVQQGGADYSENIFQNVKNDSALDEKYFSKLFKTAGEQILGIDHGIRLFRYKSATEFSSRNPTFEEVQTHASRLLHGVAVESIYVKTGIVDLEAPLESESEDEDEGLPPSPASITVGVEGLTI